AAEKQDNLTAGVDIEITKDNVINATVDLSGYYTSDTVDAALDTKADTELSNITASAGSVISALADSEIDYYTPNHIIVAEGDYSSYTTTLSSGTEYFDLSYYFQNTNAQCYICDFVTSIGSSSTDNAFYYTELEHESGEIYWGQTTIPINRTTSGSTQSQTQFSAYVPACAPYLVIEHTVAGLIVGLIAIKPLKHLPLTDKTWLTYGARTYYGEYKTEVNNNNVYITDDNE
ncbi:MAG: hypothetical protein LUB59_05610, partial [Candidatus Gastranaerophilales bacterium]|nr:hypothetical protein [Candidatus Gastranaerophilales bacterium]